MISAKILGLISGLILMGMAGFQLASILSIEVGMDLKVMGGLSSAFMFCTGAGLMYSGYFEEMVVTVIFCGMWLSTSVPTLIFSLNQPTPGPFYLIVLIQSGISTGLLVSLIFSGLLGLLSLALDYRIRTQPKPEEESELIQI